MIGDGAPQGICGSGLIDAVAAALDVGLVDWTGLIQIERRDHFPAALAARLAHRGEERLLILVPHGAAAGGGEIVLTQDDVRQLQLAKGAIGGGIRMLQHVLQVPDEALTDLMLAGGFGNYLSIRSAVRIGLIPPLAPDRIRYVGQRRRARGAAGSRLGGGAGSRGAARPLDRAPVAGDPPRLPGPVRGRHELPEGVRPRPRASGAQVSGRR